MIYLFKTGSADDQRTPRGNTAIGAARRAVQSASLYALENRQGRQPSVAAAEEPQGTQAERSDGTGPLETFPVCGKRQPPMRTKCVCFTRRQWRQFVINAMVAYFSVYFFFKNEQRRLAEHGRVQRRRVLVRRIRLSDQARRAGQPAAQSRVAQEHGRALCRRPWL